MKKILSIILLSIIIIGSNISEIQCEEYSYSEINIEEYKTIEEELKILPKKLLQDLNQVGVTIDIDDKFLENSKGKYAGAYFWDSKEIILDNAPEEIKHATIHEIGHALDGIWALNDNDNIKHSYLLSEINFDSYYYSNIKEYVAQSISEYYKGTLKKDTIIYKELHDIFEVYV